MSSEQRDSQIRSSASSYAVVFLGIGFQILLLFALSILTASFFGASGDMDAFLTAMIPPTMFSAMLAGTGGPLLITLLSGQKKDPTDRSTAALVICLLGALAISGAIIGTVFSEFLMHQLHPGFDEKRQVECARLFRVLVWLLPLNTLTGLFQSVLHASLKFFVPSVAGVLGPMLTVGLVTYWGASYGVAGVAWAVVSGGVLAVLWTMPAVLRLLWWPQWSSFSALRSMGLLAIPMLIGVVFSRIDPMVDQYVGSFLAEGRIAQLSWAGRILTPFISLTSGTLSTVTFPRLAFKAAVGGKALRREMETGLRILITLCLPALMALLIFAEPLVKDLFERGEFTPADTHAVAHLLRILSFMLLGAAVGEMCSKFHYAMKDTLTPNLVISGLLILGFGAKFLLTPRFGISAVAMMTMIVSVNVGGCLLILMQRQIGLSFDHAFRVHFLRCSLATTAAVFVGEGILWSGVPMPAIVGLLTGGLVYFSLLLMMDPETRLLIDRIRHREDDTGSITAEREENV